MKLDLGAQLDEVFRRAGPSARRIRGAERAGEGGRGSRLAPWVPPYMKRVGVVGAAGADGVGEGAQRTSAGPAQVCVHSGTVTTTRKVRDEDQMEQEDREFKK